MTNNTGKKRNARKKYNYLDRKGTTKTRHDYIETNYVNGVRNPGEEDFAIRPMTEDEKQWLSQFVQETEHGNLNKTAQIKAEVKALKDLRSDYRTAKRKENVAEMERLYKEIENKRIFIEQLRDSCNNFYTSEEDVKEIYTRDNERRRDVYNNAKISDNLVLYDIYEYDKFSTESIQDINPENLILEHLNYVPKSKHSMKSKTKGTTNDCAKKPEDFKKNTNDT